MYKRQVVKRATLDAPHEVSKKNAEIEREANVHAKNFQVLAQEAEDKHVAAEAAAVQRAAPHGAGAAGLNSIKEAGLFQPNIVRQGRYHSTTCRLTGFSTR